MCLAVALTSYITTCLTRPLHTALRLQQPWHSGVQLAPGVGLILHTWMCRSKTQEVQHQNTAPSSSVVSGTDHYVCLKAIPNHLLAERNLNAWLFLMPDVQKKKKVLLLS